MQRSTHTLVTSLTQTTIVYYTYLTGREEEDIQEQTMLAMNPKLDDKSGIKFGEFSGSLVTAGKHALINKLVVSVNGSTDNVLEALRDLPADDYNEVIDALNELSKKK